MQENVLTVQFSGIINPTRVGVSIKKRDGHYFITNTKSGEEYESNMSKELLADMLTEHFGLFHDCPTAKIELYCGPFTAQVNRCCSFPKKGLAPVVARFVQYLDSL